MEIVPPAIGSLAINEDDVLSHSTDLFSLPGNEITMLDSYEVAYKPTHLDDDGPYNFVITPQGNNFIDLKASRLWLEVKVASETGADLTGDEIVYATNSFGTSFVDSIEISFDGSKVSDLTNTHAATKAYLETLLSFSPDAKHLESQGWTLDNTETDADEGLAKRKYFDANKKVLECIAPLHSDFIQGDRLFPPGSDLGITISKSKDSFLLYTSATDKKYKVKVQNMKLLIRYIRLTDTATGGILDRIASSGLVYPFTKNIVKRHTTLNQITDVYIQNFVTGSLPKSLLVWFSTEDSESKFSESTFKFAHHDLTYAALKVNGKTVPSIPYELKDTNTNWLARVFRDFNDNVGIAYENHSNMVDMNSYKTNSFILAFDFSPDKCNGFHTHMPKTGVIDIELRFKNTLSKPIYVNGLLSYNAILTIDRKKVVQVHW